ncbi:MAG TPA: hypothetical protein PLW73_05170 [Methanoregulaceae archaeon]|nr:hypothetical protein [Methanoregulaceae archaeon]
MCDDAPGFIVHSSPAAAPSRSSHHASHRARHCVPYAIDALRLAALDLVLMHSVTGARSGRCGHPLSRPLVASRGGTATPFAPRPDGTASSSPKGEAVIMIDALRATPFSGAFYRITVFHATATSGP